MKANETTVATFSDLDKANRVKDELVAAGVNAVVYDQSKLEKFWFLSKPLAAEKVVVDEKDFEKARALLKAADAEYHVLSGEIRCPSCGSADIEYPQFTRKFMTTTLVEVCCFLHILDKSFYCSSCHHTWPVKNLVEKETDVLNWPSKDGALVQPEKS